MHGRTQGSGKISKSELKGALEKLTGKHVDEASLQTMIQTVDANADGELDFAEFMQLAYILKEHMEIDVHGITMLTNMSRQQSKAQYRRTQNMGSGDAAKANFKLLFQLVYAALSAYVAIIALDAGSPERDTCLPGNATDPTAVVIGRTDAEVISDFETAEDWESLTSALYSWALMVVINAVSAVVLVLCAPSRHSYPVQFTHRALVSR